MLVFQKLNNMSKINFKIIAFTVCLSATIGGLAICFSPQSVATEQKTETLKFTIIK